jgi:DNA-binding NarL/FixJ family response regulator
MRENEHDQVPGAAGRDSASVQTPPRIAVVVWARHYRESLLGILRDREDFEVMEVSPSDDGDNARLLENPPDVVLLDLPSTELGTLVRRLHTAHASLKLIALNREGTESELLALFEAGLTVYVPTAATSA